MIKDSARGNTLVANSLDFSEFRKLINGKMSAAINLRLVEAGKIGSKYVRLWQAISTTTMAGGKRLRPYLFILGYNLQRTSLEDEVIKASLALEMLHQGLLVHDDIIDKDNVRHGQPNIAGIFLDHYSGHLQDKSRAAALASNAAMLAGDLMIAEAFHQVNECGLADDAKVKLCKRLSYALYDVIGGQMMDMESVFWQREDVDPVMVAKYKTASYSFMTPLVAGAELAGAPEAALAHLAKIGEEIGIAYQLHDDILGVFGDPSTTGKPPLGDIKEGKRTLLIDLAIRHSNASNQELIKRCLGDSELSADHIKKLQVAIKSSGAFNQVQIEIQARFNAAKNLMAHTEGNQFAVKELLELMNLLAQDGHPGGLAVV